VFGAQVRVYTIMAYVHFRLNYTSIQQRAITAQRCVAQQVHLRNRCQFSSRVDTELHKNQYKSGDVNY